jgi:hypothetical protein
MEKKTNGLGIAGGVVGIAMAATAPAFSWFFAPFYVLATAAAIVLSGMALRNALKDGSPKGMAIAGLATAVPTFIWSAIWSLTMLGLLASASTV